MSTSYFLVCHDCRIGLNVASSGGSGFHLTAERNPLEAFLLAHKEGNETHRLEVVSEPSMDQLATEGYDYIWDESPDD